MTSSLPSFFVRSLVTLSLAVVGFVGATSTAEAAPLCTNRLHTSAFCVQPSGQPTCAKGYGYRAGVCQAVNPHGANTPELFTWDCPSAPLGAPVIANGGNTGPFGRTYVASCTYWLPPTATLYSPTVLDLWG